MNTSKGIEQNDVNECSRACDCCPTEGEWYVAERAMWHCDVRFVRTSEDKSGVVGVTNDRNAKLISAAPELLRACQAALTLSAVSDNRDAVFNQIAAAVRKAVVGCS